MRHADLRGSMPNTFQGQIAHRKADRTRQQDTEVQVAGQQALHVVGRQALQQHGAALQLDLDIQRGAAAARPLCVRQYQRRGNGKATQARKPLNTSSICGAHTNHLGDWHPRHCHVQKVMMWLHVQALALTFDGEGFLLLQHQSITAVSCPPSVYTVKAHTHCSPACIPACRFSCHTTAVFESGPVSAAAAACAASNIAAPGSSGRPDTRCAHRNESPAAFASRHTKPVQMQERQRPSLSGMQSCDPRRRRCLAPLPLCN